MQVYWLLQLHSAQAQDYLGPVTGIHKYDKLLQLHLAQAQDYLGPVTGIHKYDKLLQLWVHWWPTHWSLFDWVQFWVLAQCCIYNTSW